MKGKQGFAKISADGYSQGYNFIAMELLGPSIKTLFKNRGKGFTLSTVLKIGYDLVNLLEELHGENIVHGDIKPDNITIGLDNQTKLYLIDFGLAYTIGTTGSKPEQIKYVVGTFDYLSLGAHQAIVSFKNDLQSLAIMMVHLLYNKLPWNTDRSNNYKKTFDLKKKFFYQPPSYLPREISSFIRAIGKMPDVDRPNYDLLRSITK